MKAALEKTGLTVDEVLEAAAIVIVRGSEAHAENARRIVRCDRRLQRVQVGIGPPDAAVS